MEKRRKGREEGIFPAPLAGDRRERKLSRWFFPKRRFHPAENAGA